MTRMRAFELQHDALALSVFGYAVVLQGMPHNLLKGA